MKKLDHNAKKTELENKIPTGLGTTSTLTTVENKIPNVSNLVTKQIIIQKLMKLKRNVLIIIMINTLLGQNLTSLQQNFLMQD